MPVTRRLRLNSMGKGDGWKGATSSTQKFKTFFQNVKKHGMAAISALNKFSFESESLVLKNVSMLRPWTNQMERNLLNYVLSAAVGGAPSTNLYILRQENRL